MLSSVTSGPTVVRTQKPSSTMSKTIANTSIFVQAVVGQGIPSSWSTRTGRRSASAGLTVVSLPSASTVSFLVRTSALSSRERKSVTRTPMPSLRAYSERNTFIAAYSPMTGATPRRASFSTTISEAHQSATSTAKTTTSGGHISHSHTSRRTQSSFWSLLC